MGPETVQPQVGGAAIRAVGFTCILLQLGPVVSGVGRGHHDGDRRHSGHALPSDDSGRGVA
eukprot:7634993-Heterocapsa_arctica.AAC.1